MKSFANRFSAIIVTAALASSPLGAFAATVALKADLTASTEVPPKASQGTGELSATLDTDTNVLKYHLTYSGLTGPATAAHFHGPAAVGANAKPQVPLKAAASPIDGQATLTPEQAKDLEAGQWYVNVHTAANPGGEIRGQVVAAQ
jgi:CHRD domain